ncbi:MAG: GNAT family N-acetyltransferase [Rhizomicrobium sp.]
MGKVSPLSAPEPIADTHDLSRFDCGKDALNDWLRSRAARSEGRSSRCYVVCAGRAVVGYYSLSTGAVRHDGAGRTPRALRANMPDPTPVMVLGRLAVDKEFQGRGIGKDMLRDALLRVLAASRIVGARALIVHAIDDEAVPFYAGFGFRSFAGDVRTMFLPMEAIKRAV